MEKQINKDFRVLLKASIWALCIIIVINIGVCVFFCNSLKNIQKQNQQSIVSAIENLQINDSKNNFKLVVTDEVQQNIKTITDKDYYEYLIQNKENQSFWLNFWLTVLSVILAVLGLIVPICFIKLYQDKRDEIDKLIDKTERQKDKMGDIIEDTKEQKRLMKLDVDSVKRQSKEVDVKADKMSKDLEEIKQYVNEAKALAKYNEAYRIINDQSDNKPEQKEKAKRLLLESIEMNPNNDKALYTFAELLFKEKDYQNAKDYIDKALSISERPDYYYLLGLIYKRQNIVEPAVENITKAIEKESDSVDRAFYYSIIANIYSNVKDEQKTIENINKSLSFNYKKSYIYNNLSSAYVKVGHYKEAINILEDIKSLGLANATTYYNITEAYIFDENYEKAHANLKEYVLKQDRNDCFGIYNDDYANWMGKLSGAEQTPTIKTMIEMINNLVRRDRVS